MTALMIYFPSRINPWYSSHAINTENQWTDCKHWIISQYISEYIVREYNDSQQLHPRL